MAVMSDILSDMLSRAPRRGAMAVRRLRLWASRAARGSQRRSVRRCGRSHASSSSSSDKGIKAIHPLRSFDASGCRRQHALPPGKNSQQAAAHPPRPLHPTPTAASRQLPGAGRSSRTTGTRGRVGGRPRSVCPTAQRLLSRTGFLTAHPCRPPRAPPQICRPASLGARGGGLWCASRPRTIEHRGRAACQRAWGWWEGSLREISVGFGERCGAGAGGLSDRHIVDIISSIPIDIPWMPAISKACAGQGGTGLEVERAR